MEITNPKRVLVVGAPDAGVESVIQELTGAPLPSSSALAGTSHTLALKTAYYTANLPLWIDEIPNLEEWKTEFLDPAAKEVINALGGVIYVFRRPISRDRDQSQGANGKQASAKETLENVTSTMRAITSILETHSSSSGYGWEGVCLALCTPQSTTPYLELPDDEWDDTCREEGFEYIDASQTGKNEYGEMRGVARVREALEANDWDAGDDDDADSLGFGEDGLDGEENEARREFEGLRMALQRAGEGEEDDEEAKVEDLERMMGRLQAVRERNEGLPEEQRRREAAKAVRELMKEF